ncbi:HEPN domain-containing protein [Methylobacterium fujisawaense]|uniref:HEPN domain-containing protein n=1 Tax=Methylobacterium fujisawaense TaxID=107400 RepID=UPI00313E21DE
MRGASNPIDWLNKARQDARSARRLLVEPPELEVAAYHVQQVVEKAIKSYLAAEGIRYPRGGGAGHDLEVLANLIPQADPLHTQALSLAYLTPWATAYRYPADDPMTAEPPPARSQIEHDLLECEAFIEAVAQRVALVPPSRGCTP